MATHLETTMTDGMPDIGDVLDIDPAALDDTARTLASMRVRKWIAQHGEDVVRTKRGFFLKHLAVLGVHCTRRG